jgi:histidine triad (HIT) family protein
MTDCLFCDVIARRYPAEFVLDQSAVVAFMDQLRQPEDVGHVLVIPRAHVENIYGVDDALGAALFNAHARIARAVKRALAPDGITTWSSNERGAGQEIPHFHLHVFTPHRLAVPDRPSGARDPPSCRVAGARGRADPGGLDCRLSVALASGLTT